MPNGSKNIADTLTKQPKDQPLEVVIAEYGDIYLGIRDRRTGTLCHYLCSRRELCNASEYFAVLLDPHKFSEGIAIDAKLQKFYRHHNEPRLSSSLPQVSIGDIEGFSGSSPPIEKVITLFFNILHDPGTPWSSSRSHSPSFVAKLAIVADRYGAHVCIASYLRKNKLDVTLWKDKRSAARPMRELEHRQRLLAGMIFGISHWVSQSSAALINSGSERWISGYSDASGEDNKTDDDVSWWKLPGDIEEEMLCRRQYILETLSSMQKHFIALYSSRQPQCKLGYGSSPNCDSYQLGEIVRFFSRKGLLRIESAFTSAAGDPLEPYGGCIEEILTKYKECPSYQIDSFHQHCGLRVRMVPLLESLWPLSQVAICFDCWKTDKSAESWLQNPGGGIWTWTKRTGFVGGCENHREAKAMYTACTRNWTPN